MKIKQVFNLFIICNMWGACTNIDQDMQLEVALRESGANRKELEKVLQHYSTESRDSLKLQAAEFLIKNMPGHYTLEGELIDSYYEKLNQHPPASYFTRKIFDLCVKSKKETLQYSIKKEDLLCIKADYLIRHIDSSFSLLQKCPWTRNIPFEDFLEYLLPYRLENESLDLWLDSLKIQEKTINEINYKDDIKGSVNEVEGYVHLSMPEASYDEKLLKSIVYANCRDDARRDVYRKRAKGIPAAVDFIPYYPNRNGYHYWETTINPEIKHREVAHLYTRKAAKVYRRTFSHNDVVKPIGDEYIPEFFLDPFNKDVSDSYFNTNDILVDLIDLPLVIKHVYLCVFNDLAWIPVAVADVKERKALFKNMGKGIVYLLAYYNDKKFTTLNVPFVSYINGDIKYCTPDTNARSNLCLTRKYPFNKDLYKFSENIKGTSIVASNDCDFRIADTIGYVHSDNMHYFYLLIENEQKYRYWKLVGKRFTPLDVAELIFEDSNGISLVSSYESKYNQAFDGDPLTSISIVDQQPTLPIDMEKAISISRVIVLPRGDGNGIYPNDLYELLYWDKDGWKSIKRNVALDYYLDCNDIPQNALLWLRNLTTGMQERIFTWDGKEITYW